MGSYDLDEDEALVIEGRSPGCAFWNVCLWNQFLHTYDYAYERVTLNGGQVVYEPDGSWRLVIARRDPGHPNWISTAGHRRGRIWFRWFLPDATPVRPTTWVRIGATGWSNPRADGRGRDRPGPVVLDDLASPRFSPEIEQLRAAMEDMAPPCPLEPDASWPRPRSNRPGSHDFGDGALLRPAGHPVPGAARRSDLRPRAS